MPDGRGISLLDSFPIFDGPAGDIALTIDGYTIQGAIAPWSFGWSTPGATIQMADGTSCHQMAIPKPKQPIAMEPAVGSFDILIAYKDDFIRLRRASGLPNVLVFMGEPLEDQWYIANADAGQTTWRTSRRIGWNGTTRTHATHPPSAYIVTGTTQVAQTIITGGTPAAGEVKVPTAQTADQFYDTITTPALSAGDRLVFGYWPERVVKLRVSNAYPETNRYVISVEMEESLNGDY